MMMMILGGCCGRAHVLWNELNELHTKFV